MNNHIPEWKAIRERYIKSEKEQHIKYRIEALDRLIKGEENKVELNHFK